MPHARRPLAGEVALVSGAGEGVGRAVALALAAREVGVVVMGPEERALGRVVGEATCGGGMARHLAGDAKDLQHIERGVQKAFEAFGKLTIVVAVSAKPLDAARLFEAARPRLGRHGRALLIVPVEPFGSGEGPSAEAFSVELPGTALGSGAKRTHPSAFATESGDAATGRLASTTFNTLVWAGGDDADEQALVDVALFLCSDRADGVDGQTIVVTSPSTDAQARGR